MPMAFLVLLGFQLLGEILRRTTHIPLPGPVIGMFLLTVALVFRGRNDEEGSRPPTHLSNAAGALIRNMGLLFVPAGVGIMAEASMLRREWAPIVAGIVGSTILGVIATGVVMHRMTRAASAATAFAELDAETGSSQTAGKDT